MPSIQDRRVWIGGGAAVGLLIAAAGWFLFIHPELSSADDLHQQAAATRLQNEQIAHNVDVLKAKSAHLTKFTAELKHVLEEMPAGSGLPAFTRQVTAQATANHIKLTSISVGQVTALVGAAPVTTPDSTSTDDGAASSAAPTPSATAAPATDEPTTAATAAPAAAASGIYTIAITLVADGDFVDQTKFLTAVRTGGPRYGLISNVQFAPGAGAKQSSIDGASAMTVQLKVFSSPLSPEQMAADQKLLNGDIGN